MKQGFRLWHRRIGVLSALFVLLLSITGIALNHTDLLRLSQQSIKSQWLLDHYGIKPPTDLRFYQIPNVTVMDNLVWFDKNMLVEVSGRIIAVVKLNSHIAIVMEDQLYLYNEQGLLVDHIDTNLGLPRDIQQVNIKNNILTLKTKHGYWASDEQLLSWHEILLNNEPKWVLSSGMSIQQKEVYKLYFRAQFLTLERIILDAHSGRIFGTIGVLFMDAVAVLLIFLSLSGIYMWLRHVKNKR